MPMAVTDPAAEWTCAPGGPAFFGYSTNYLVDVRYGIFFNASTADERCNAELTCCKVGAISAPRVSLIKRACR